MFCKWNEVDINIGLGCVFIIVDCIFFEGIKDMVSYGDLYFRLI